MVAKKQSKKNSLREERGREQIGTQGHDPMIHPNAWVAPQIDS